MFFPKKGCVTKNYKHKMDKNITYYFNEVRGKKKKKVTAVRKAVKKELKDCEDGVPASITIKNGKCTVILRRWTI